VTPLRSTLAVVLSALAMALLLTGCTGDDGTSEVQSTAIGDVSAHVGDVRPTTH
jgi:hypothetical protein